MSDINMSKQSLKFEQYIKASPSQVYYAFTNATALREWLCEVATVMPQLGGRVYLTWHTGYYTCGEYTALEKDKEFAFTWQGRGEPGQTRVCVSLSEQDGGVLVRLAHDGIGDGEEWANTAQEYQAGWKNGLENLASVLETGEDLRFTQRPMLGILGNDFTPEQAKALGVPVTQGLRLGGVVEGLGAQAAGLQADDVIVGMDGHEITTYPSLLNAMQAKRAGDKVEMVFYRGPEKKSVLMELSRRPIPEIPMNIPGLAEKIRQEYARMEAELDEFFEGVSEQQASFKPAPDEWSAKEVLAHLIQSERFQQSFAAELVNGYERQADGFGGNLDAVIQAALSAYPTLAELLDGFQARHRRDLRTVRQSTAGIPGTQGQFLAVGAGRVGMAVSFRGAHRADEGEYRGGGGVGALAPGQSGRQRRALRVGVGRPVLYRPAAVGLLRRVCVGYPKAGGLVPIAFKGSLAPSHVGL